MHIRGELLFQGHNMHHTAQHNIKIRSGAMVVNKFEVTAPKTLKFEV